MRELLALLMAEVSALLSAADKREMVICFAE